MSLKKIRYWVCSASVAFIFILIPFALRAQMFSVDKADKQSITPDVAIYAGVEAMDFNYQGNGDAGSAGLYSFKGPILRFLLETPGVNLSIGTGGSVTGLDNTAYFDAGLKTGYGFPLYLSKKMQLLFPVQLHSSYTSVTNDMLVAGPSVPEFQQGTFQLGAGLDFTAQITSQLRVGANFVPSYGFSFSTRERDKGGSIFSALGKARLYFDHLLGSAGLSLGYNYHFRQFDIDGQTLDYNAIANSFLIGITF